MSERGQRPEHLIIREYCMALVEQKRVTWVMLRDAFVGVYIDLIAPGPDVPVFEPIHRHDTAKEMERKDEANLKKLVRAIEGKTYFPLAFKEPLIEALDHVQGGLGTELRKRLLRDQGLMYIPLTLRGDGKDVYSEFLCEFAEANTAIVNDMSDDGRLNDPKTRKEVLDSLEQHIAVLRHMDATVQKDKS